MAIMTVLLAGYANEKIDVLKTVTMLLIHDIVEIDAGDTYAYDEDAKKTQREREVKAADRIFGLLPEKQGKEFRALWEEFEAQETAESDDGQYPTDHVKCGYRRQSVGGTRCSY